MTYKKETIKGRNFQVDDQEELLGICKELEDWSVQHELVSNTSLSYPDIKYIWRVLMDVAGEKRCVRPESAKCLSEITFIMQQKPVQSVFYQCSGLNSLDLDNIIHVLMHYSAEKHLDTWYAITHLLQRGNEGQLLDEFLPYKSNIRFGWRLKRIVSNDLCRDSLESEQTGYNAVSLWLIVTADNDAERTSLCEGIEKILINDLSEGNICLGSSLSEHAKNMIMDGYDPLMVIEPLVINDAQWIDCILPALNKFERYLMS